MKTKDQPRKLMMDEHNYSFTSNVVNQYELNIIKSIAWILLISKMNNVGFYLKQIVNILSIMFDYISGNNFIKI